MTNMRSLVLLVTIMLLSACATNVLRTGQPGIILSPASLGETISVQQRILLEQGEHMDTIDIVLEVDSKHLEMIGLVIGKRVLSLHYDGNKLTSWRHFLLPDKVQAEDVLENLQLALWPSDVIKKALPPDWEIKEDNNLRALYLGDEKIIEIIYNVHPRWVGTIKFTNSRYNYTLNIQSALIE